MPSIYSLSGGRVARSAAPYTLSEGIWRTPYVPIIWKAIKNRPLLMKLPVPVEARETSNTSGPLLRSIAGSPAAPARYFRIADGKGGFYTFPSLT